MTGVSPEDVAALLAQGDLREFFRAQEGAGAGQAPPAEDTPPARRPGEWPAGTQRPTPPPPIPAHVVQAAVDEYRAWANGEGPTTPIHCDCQSCRILEKRS